MNKGSSASRIKIVKCSPLPLGEAAAAAAAAAALAPGAPCRYPDPVDAAAAAAAAALAPPLPKFWEFDCALACEWSPGYG
jgi:hypothetical protein